MFYTQCIKCLNLLHIYNVYIVYTLSFCTDYNKYINMIALSIKSM